MYVLAKEITDTFCGHFPQLFLVQLYGAKGDFK